MSGPPTVSTATTSSICSSPTAARLTVVLATPGTVEAKLGDELVVTRGRYAHPGDYVYSDLLAPSTINGVGSYPDDDFTVVRAGISRLEEKTAAGSVVTSRPLRVLSCGQPKLLGG